MVYAQEFLILPWMEMHLRPLSWQISWHMTCWRRMRTCILIYWAFILVNLSALEKGMQISNDISKRVRYTFQFFLNFCFLASSEALEFARAKLTHFGKVQKYVERLEVCLISDAFPLSAFSSEWREFCYWCRTLWPFLHMKSQINPQRFICLAWSIGRKLLKVWIGQFLVCYLISYVLLPMVF